MKCVISIFFSTLSLYGAQEDAQLIQNNTLYLPYKCNSSIHRYAHIWPSQNWIQEMPTQLHSFSNYAYWKGTIYSTSGEVAHYGIRNNQLNNFTIQTLSKQLLFDGPNDNHPDIKPVIIYQKEHTDYSKTTLFLFDYAKNKELTFKDITDDSRIHRSFALNSSYKNDGKIIHSFCTCSIAMPMNTDEDDIRYAKHSQVLKTYEYHPETEQFFVKKSTHQAVGIKKVAWFCSNLILIHRYYHVYITNADLEDSIEQKIPFKIDHIAIDASNKHTFYALGESNLIKCQFKRNQETKKLIKTYKILMKDVYDNTSCADTYLGVRNGTVFIVQQLDPHELSIKKIDAQQTLIKNFPVGEAILTRLPPEGREYFLQHYIDAYELLPFVKKDKQEHFVEQYINDPTMLDTDPTIIDL